MMKTRIYSDVSKTVPRRYTDSAINEIAKAKFTQPEREIPEHIASGPMDEYHTWRELVDARTGLQLP